MLIAEIQQYQTISKQAWRKMVSMTSGVGQKTMVLHMAMGDIMLKNIHNITLLPGTYLQTVLHPVQRPLPLPSAQKASCFVSLRACKQNLRSKEFSLKQRHGVLMQWQNTFYKLQPVSVNNKNLKSIGRACISFLCIVCRNKTIPTCPGELPALPVIFQFVPTSNVGRGQKRKISKTGEGVKLQSYIWGSQQDLFFTTNLFLNRETSAEPLLK